MNLDYWRVVSRQHTEVSTPAPIISQEIEASNRSFFGEIAPKHGVRYFACIVWTLNEYGDRTIIQSSIRVGEEIITNSPWLFRDMTNFIGDNPDAQVEGEVYQFDGIYVWSDEFGKGRFEGTTSACEIVRKDYQTWKQ